MANEWILGQPVATDVDDEEWILGHPYILIEEEEEEVVGMSGAMTTNTGYWGW